MKKMILLFLFATACIRILHAQSGDDAIGLRIGGSDGVNAEISYQMFISGPNRLEFDLGFIDADGFSGFKGTVMYHWVKNLNGGFDWFLGAGGSLGAWSLDDNQIAHNDIHDDGLFVDGNGQIGIEYNFDIPLQISLDARPEIGIINDDFDFGYGLGIRYRF